jgi:hypothetical protein
MVSRSTRRTTMRSRIASQIVGLMVGFACARFGVAGDTTVASSTWQADAMEEIRRSEYRFSRAESGAWTAPNRAHGLRSRFDASGLVISSRTAGENEAEGGFSLELRLSAFGRSGSLAALPRNHPEASGSRIEVRHDALTEWYVNDDRGLEQGFTIPSPPREGDPRAPLVLEMDLAGGLRGYPSEDGRAIVFRGARRAAELRYGGLLVLDAANREVSARLEVAPGRLRIVVQDADAVYPLTVDPIVTSPSWSVEPNVAGAVLGWSLSTAGDVNGDGYSDVVIGVPGWGTASPGNQGAVFVYHGSAAGLPTSATATRFGDDAGSSFFGSSVSAAGDVDGDGYGDVIVGARGFDNGVADEGGAYVYFGTSAGLAASYGWRVESDQPLAQLGRAVAGIGDVNGDGYDDVAVGGPLSYTGEFQEGQVFVWYGGASGLGSLEDTVADADWSAEANQASSLFGDAVGTALDVNGDGYDDLVVGAATYDNGEADEGRAFLWLGGASGLGSDGVPGNADWTAESNLAGGNLGKSVATAGDVNGDGYADVVVGAPAYEDLEDNEGQAFVWHGSSAGLGATGTPANADWKASGNSVGAAMGWSVATAGDVNGDGFADVLVGASGIAAPTTLEGGAFVWLGGPSGLGPFGNPLNDDWSAVGGVAFARYGWSVSTAGDTDGDGFSEILVGASQYSGGQTNEGRAYLYEGSAAGPAMLVSWVEGGAQTNSKLGHSVASAGDVNGDGYSDVIVGAYLYDNGETDEGRVFVYHGSATGLPTSSSWSAEGNQVSAGLGSSARSAGDVNGDGYSDVIVGAYLYDNGASNTGAAFVWHGSASGLGVTGNPANADWSLLGTQATAGLGWSVASAGDVNGDGYCDVLIGTPWYDKGAVLDQGLAALYLGSAGGLSATTTWSPSGAQSTAYFGYSVASAGDVNGDGYSDVIVGARNHDNGATDEGRAYVYHGSPATPSSTASWTAESDQASARMGEAVATAGDVNGDGYSDVLVGTPAYDGLGRAFLWLGGPSGLGASGTPANADWFAQAFQSGAGLGGAVASAGDVNADGYGDVVIGASFYDNGTSGEAGAAYLWLGSGTGLGGFGTPSNADWSVAALEVGAFLGGSVGSAGDVNGDGFADVLLGAEGAGLFPGVPDEGTAHVYYGNDGDGLHRTAQQRRLDGTAPIDLFGKSDAAAGFGLRVRGRTAAGRGDVRLEWEVKPLGTPLDGTDLSEAASFVDTGTPISTGSSVLLTEAATGLASATRYHWRLRVHTRSPLFPRSIWLSLPYNERSETDLLSGGFPDLDGDGYQSDVDCNDGNDAIWGTPGEALDLVFAADKATLSVAPPVDPGGLVSSLLYDTVRSGIPSDFVGAATCVETNGGPDTSAVDASTPVAGSVFYYLVRAENACGVGALGTWTDGTPRTVRTCP